MAPKKAKKPLTPSSIFVRVRPVDETGGHVQGEAGRKAVSKWDGKSVTVQDNDRRQETTFNVTGVVPPERDQEGAVDAMLPELLAAFHDDSNVLFFAYGQTGSGKTHTMLGEVGSLASAEPVPGWGIFPRMVHRTLAAMDAITAAGGRSVLIASAVEFYCCGGYDLMAGAKGQQQVTIDSDASVFGCGTTELRSTADLQSFITTAYGNRVTAKTKMNDASSRSHVCLILTLHQRGPDDGYKRTSFSLVDMAGSERASKTGAAQMTGYDAFVEASRMFEAGTPGKLSIGAQGVLINYELSFLTTEILKAADMHRKGINFRAQREMSTGATYYFSACCDGRARLGACITVSQAPQHGFESWFSLKYAEELMKCRAPLVRVKAVKIGKALEEAEQRSKACADAFAKVSQSTAPSTAKQAMAFGLRKGQKEHAAALLQVLKGLAA